MKKITLMLCACAMAFAGLLVSCSNGSEKIIYTDTTSYDYAYTVSGSKVVTTESASDKAVLLTTTTETSSFSTGGAIITWEENDDTTQDWKNYKIKVNPGRGDIVTSEKYSGTSASGMTAPEDDHLDNTAIDPLELQFYSLGDAYFIGNKKFENWNNNGQDTSFAAKTEDEVKALTSTITVTGKIAEDDKLTIVYTLENYNTGTDPVVNKQTTVYTFNLVKAGSAE